MCFARCPLVMAGETSVESDDGAVERLYGMAECDTPRGADDADRSFEHTATAS